MREAARREGVRAGRSGEALPWIGLSLSVASLAALITVALFTRTRVNQLSARNADLREQADALAAANRRLTSAQAALEKRLKAAEARCAALDSKIPDAAELRSVAARVAKDEIARLRPRRDPERNPAIAGNARADMEKRGDEIAAIREKVRKGEMTEEQGRKAISARVQDGLKAALPGDTLKRMEQARAEREKNMTPEQKKQAAKNRNAVIDGIGDWMEVQKKVREGKLTREQARELMREKWRARIEEFRKMREAQQKMPEAKEEF